MTWWGEIYHSGCNLGGVTQAGSNKVGDPGRGCNGERERNVEGRRGNRHQDALCRELNGTELARGDGQNFQHGELRFNHDHAREGELEHGSYAC